jgi:DNA transposition AAA+ family ATPase
MTDGARDLLLNLAVNHAQGGMRRLTTLFRRCVDMANAKGSVITQGIVQAADGLALL